MSSKPSISSPLSSSWTIADLKDEPDASEVPSHSTPSVTWHSSSTTRAHLDIRINPLVPCLEITQSDLGGADHSSLLSYDKPSDKEFIDGLKQRFLDTMEATKPKLISKYVEFLNKTSSCSISTAIPDSSCPSPSSLLLDTQAEIRALVQETSLTNKDVSWENALNHFNTRARSGWKKMLEDIAENKASSYANDLNKESRKEGRGSYEITWKVSIQAV
ncbi:hypothetical protein I302_101862 [Kwoniella bestiolae CBS 10118]|uniref:Uncharacterized protein n=1 Tax=Kwoniella bestiolae CBS 10118 TaxID=1296100 RepID=A0A1B9GDE5_9TREE|nr:hypothetical protein I302_00541 [Kwoniella bestiolae CBS 10118]OCF29050.1 hypothetical protein I302_00541 [Kwoniella bestiolae CBS 10118]